MVILKFTDKYGHREPLEFPQFGYPANILKCQLRYHGFGEKFGPRGMFVCENLQGVSRCRGNSTGGIFRLVTGSVHFVR